MDEPSLVFSADGIRAADLDGFFVGWPDPPSAERLLEILQVADEVVVCRRDDGSVVGFATAITDRCFAAYIPLVEVLPAHQGRGLGSQMVLALLDRLRSCYMIDLVCDDDVVSFYERLGGTRLSAMAWRNYDRLTPGRVPGPRDDSTGRWRTEIRQTLIEGLESGPAGEYDNEFRERLRDRAQGTS